MKQDPSYPRSVEAYAKSPYCKKLWKDKCAIIELTSTEILKVCQKKGERQALKLIKDKLLIAYYVGKNEPPPKVQKMPKTLGKT